MSRWPFDSVIAPPGSTRGRSDEELIASQADLAAGAGRALGLSGIPGWGLKSASAALRGYGSIDRIPLDSNDWAVTIRGASRLAAALRDRLAEALLCRDLAELRTDLPLRQTSADLEWNGADRDSLGQLCDTIEDDSVVARVTRWAG